ncbi:hypothetical protein V3C99_017931 [Haemonchus contortus]
MNMAVVIDMARSYASRYPWTDSSWTKFEVQKRPHYITRRLRKCIRLLQVRAPKSGMKKPEGMEPDWFTDDYSSVLFFCRAELAGTSRWTLLMQPIAQGTDVIAGPQNDCQ